MEYKTIPGPADCPDDLGYALQSISDKNLITGFAKSNGKKTPK